MSDPHKAGYVNIIGNPNVGKSTLMNKMVGEKLAIITSKAQTTRHRILGIVNDENYQIIYSDTPGLLTPKYKLQEAMLSFALSALDDADVLLYVTDTQENIKGNEPIFEKLKEVEVPLFLIINKIDVTFESLLEKLIDVWKERLPKAVIFPISAKEGFQLDVLLKSIIEKLPEAPPYFPKDELTDKSMRFFAAETVREKILLNYTEEIPYCVEVGVNEFKDKPEIIHISCTIFVMRESQKGIVIGKGGSALKKVGTEARKDLEEFLGKKVFLELFVKVDPDWRNNATQLRRYGYK